MIQSYASYVMSQVAGSITLNLKKLESLCCTWPKNTVMTVLRRLNSIFTPDDSIANESKYDLRSWVDTKRAVQQKDGSISTQEIHDTHYVVDLKLIHFVKQELEDPARKVLTTNIVNKVYK